MRSRILLLLFLGLTNTDSSKPITLVYGLFWHLLDLFLYTAQNQRKNELETRNLFAF